jgi:integrase
VVATEEGKPLDPNILNRAFAKALKQAGVPHIRLHDSRHGYATWMLQAGVPLKVVSDQLGHSSITITGDVYAHVTREIAQTAADTLNRAFTTGQ